MFDYGIVVLTKNRLTQKKKKKQQKKPSQTSVSIGLRLLWDCVCNLNFLLGDASA